MSTVAEPSAGELRNVAIAAEVWLRVDAARQYGFITGGPEVDVERCEELIDRARAAGHVWGEADIDACARVLLGGGA